MTYRGVVIVVIILVVVAGFAINRLFFAPQRSVPIDALDSVRHLALSPDGETIAAGGARGMVGFYDAERGDLLRAFQIQSPSPDLRRIIWSPDGTRVALLVDHRPLFDRPTVNLLVMDAMDGRLLGVADAVARDTDQMIWHPNDETILTGSSNLRLPRSVIRRFDVADDGAVTFDRISRNISGRINQMRQLNDARFLTLHTRDDFTLRLVIWAAMDDQREEYTFSLVNQPALHIEGETIRVASWEGATVHAWDHVEDRSLRRWQLDAETDIRELVWSPDGRYLAVLGRSRQVYTIDTTTDTITAHGSGQRGLIWPADSRRLITPREAGVAFFAVEDT